ncbi:hypothetical protein PR048_021618 [Dryococelus australis]|uniref:Uncharacterized protein n=1 Tax=Dryococelus australis TaxID=614101 RepID=A0ABQ9GYR8_9NEOP|nr:hypothetical protein PR048_021618 [Dryococelus australis]
MHNKLGVPVVHVSPDGPGGGRHSRYEAGEYVDSCILLGLATLSQRLRQPISEREECASKREQKRTSHEWDRKAGRWLIGMSRREVEKKARGWSVATIANQVLSSRHTAEQIPVLFVDATVLAWVQSPSVYSRAPFAEGFAELLRSTRMKGQGKLEIPEKTHRPATSSGTIPTCENPGATMPGSNPVHIVRLAWKVVAMGFTLYPKGFRTMPYTYLVRFWHPGVRSGVRTHGDFSNVCLPSTNRTQPAREEDTLARAGGGGKEGERGRGKRGRGEGERGGGGKRGRGEGERGGGGRERGWGRGGERLTVHDKSYKCYEQIPFRADSRTEKSSSSVQLVLDISKPGRSLLRETDFSDNISVNKVFPGLFPSPKTG